MDILNAETQRQLHEDNQHAIAELKIRLDTLIAQNEAQTTALKLIIGSQITDTEALLRFRNVYNRLARYDQRMVDASETVVTWILRLLFAGAVGLGILGLSLAGVLDQLKGLFK